MLKIRQDTEAAGEWLTYLAKDPTNGKPVKLKVRPLRPEKTRTMNGAASAAHALVDSENYGFVPEDDGSAQLLARVMNAAPIAVGSDVVFDGRWNDELRKLALGTDVDLLNWLLEQGLALARKHVERAEGLSGN